MIITYKPKGQAEKKWVFDPEDVPQSAAELIERRFGADASYEAWLMALRKGGARAQRVLLWWLLYRDHPNMRFEDVDPTRRELDVEFTKSEIAEMITNVERNKRMDPQEKQETLDMFTQAMDEAPDDDGGKAPSPSGETSTG